MATFKDKCEEYFGSRDFYEVLSVKRTASDKEIKKAYHRLSLLVHPDRVDEAQKEVATEKFKVLGRIHSILQDEGKRRRYDECDDFDEESDFNWMEYWKTIFKKIDLKDIQRYEQEYINSETELRDIKKAYELTKGDMDRMLEYIPFSNCENEARITSIVQKMVDNGEIEHYDTFFKEPKAKKLQRKRKWEREKKIWEKTDWKEIEREIQANRQKRMQQSDSFFDQLITKYGKKSKKVITAGEDVPPPKKRKTRKTTK